MGYTEAKFEKTSVGIYWSKTLKRLQWDVLKQNLKRLQLGYTEAKFEKTSVGIYWSKTQKTSVGFPEAKFKMISVEYLKQNLKSLDQA